MATDLKLVVNATHEAAHAFMFDYFGSYVVYSEIKDAKEIQNGVNVTTTGATEVAYPRVTKANAVNHITCIFAGYRAARRIDEDCALLDTPLDENKVSWCLQELRLTPQDEERVLTQAAEQADEIIDKHFEIIREIANLMVEKRRVEGDEIREIIDRTLTTRAFPRPSAGMLTLPPPHQV